MYENKYGTEFVEVKIKPSHGATGGRGKDSVLDGVMSVKSNTWVQGFTTVYNMVVEFVQDKPEFRYHSSMQH